MRPTLISMIAMSLAVILLSSCSQKDIYKCQDGSKIRITAVQENIIHVEAIPKGASFSKDESLSVVPQKTVSTTVTTDGTVVTIATSQMSVKLDKATGAVSYYRANGEEITSEDQRSFSPIEVEGVKGYTVRQTFKNQDEAFFGLGQHQADEWNYKGKNEELYQYNTKISIPFIVSSKKYGVLWDSYSFCRWGDPRDYLQIGEVFKLYDKDGKEGSLTGTYVPRWGETLVRAETALSQEFLRTPQCDVVQTAPNFNFNGSHVTFEGQIEPSESGTFRFYLYYAGYTKVLVDGVQVMPEIWRTAWNPNGRKFECDLKEGNKHDLRIEWEPDGGVSYCGLRVLSPVPESEQGKMSWWGEMQDQIDYYLIAADDIDGVISGYRTLTGKAPIMPKWSMGYWQSRERYSTQDQVVSTLRAFRENNIPIDNIVQDWQYWEDDQWGSHEFDATRYPNPKAMVDSVHAMNGRFMISVWPKFYRYTEHFDEMNEKGWIYQTAIRDSVIDWLGYEQSFYDAYDPGARKLFWKQMYDHLYGIGVDSWWMDASEPNIHDCTDMDYRKAMQVPTALGPSTKYFNAYALMNAQAIFEGQRAVDNRRVFLLTRNGFSGLQRYSTASWSGDIGTRWEDMKAQISAGLNYSISGIPIWGQDIGGFSVENRYNRAQTIFNQTGKVTPDLVEWRELQARWHEWGVFCPLYRSHGQWPEREPWNIAPKGDPTYDAILAVDKLRYELMPYIYTMTARVHYDDYTMMRPLCMDFTDDKIALNISDEFMFGDAILVCPVYTYGARSREVYLPKGQWFDFWSKKVIEGGRTITADAPYDHIPVYVRAGQIIVTGDVIQSTAEVQKTLYVNVYGSKDASYCLYEDDGLSYDYENGEFTNIPMAWDAKTSTLSIGERTGSYKGMVENRTIKVNVITESGIKTAETEYTGKATSVAL
ncbi:MAG: DUF5110 domain-containing protein [Bacteroidales bacterium]|nr:DUF5110 domain-containing protein [Bacteroidales bacterium]